MISLTDKSNNIISNLPFGIERKNEKAKATEKYKKAVFEPYSDTAFLLSLALLIMLYCYFV